MTKNATHGIVRIKEILTPKCPKTPIVPAVGPSQNLAEGSRSNGECDDRTATLDGSQYRQWSGPGGEPKVYLGAAGPESRRYRR